jgi:hypothetical protein
MKPGSRPAQAKLADSFVSQRKFVETSTIAHNQIVGIRLLITEATLPDENRRLAKAPPMRCIAEKGTCSALSPTRLGCDVNPESAWMTTRSTSNPTFFEWVSDPTATLRLGRAR